MFCNLLVTNFISIPSDKLVPVLLCFLTGFLILYTSKHSVHW